MKEYENLPTYISIPPSQYDYYNEGYKKSLNVIRKLDSISFKICEPYKGPFDLFENMCKDKDAVNLVKKEYAMYNLTPLSYCCCSQGYHSSYTWMPEIVFAVTAIYIPSDINHVLIVYQKGNFWNLILFKPEEKNEDLNEILKESNSIPCMKQIKDGSWKKEHSILILLTNGNLRL